MGINTDESTDLAKEAKQDTANTSLSSIDDKLSFANVDTTGTITGASQSVQADCNGKAVALMSISGTFVATIQLAVSLDGTTWDLIPGHVVGSTLSSTQVTSPNRVYIRVVGYNYVRAFSTSYTSGTVDIRISTSPHHGMVSAWQHGTWTVRIFGSLGELLSTGYGAIANALRVAAQIGNSNGEADFDSGASSAQTLRVRHC